MKKMVIGILLFLLIVGTSLGGTKKVVASSSTKPVYLTAYKFTLSGQEVNLDNPILAIDGRAYLPVKDVGSLLGYDISFVKEDKRIDAKLNEEKIPTTIGDFITAIAKDRAYELAYSEGKQLTYPGEQTFIGLPGPSSILENSSSPPPSRSAGSILTDKIAVPSTYKFSLNGEEVGLEHPIVIVDEHAYLPVRDVGTSLGYDISGGLSAIDAYVGPDHFPKELNDYVKVASEAAARKLVDNYSTPLPHDSNSTNNSSVTKNPASNSTPTSGGTPNSSSSDIQELQQEWVNFQSIVQEQIDEVKRERPLASRYTEEEYDQMLKQKWQEKLKVQSNIDVLSLDTSREAEQKRGQLKAQLDELNNAIDDLAKDQSAVIRIKALQKQLTERKQVIDSKIHELQS